MKAEFDSLDKIPVRKDVEKSGERSLIIEKERKSERSLLIRFICQNFKHFFI